jgi:hypothetical protein
VQGKVIELQGVILAAQSSALAAQSDQLALLEDIRGLKQKMADLEAWAAEKKRYKLTDYGGGTFAYALKPDAAEGEPAHRVCADCYQKGHKSILQFIMTTVNRQERHICPSCKTEFNFGMPQKRQQPSIDRGGGGRF